MRSIPANCPNCEARQAFRARSRPIGDNRVEVFISCTVCRWERVMYESSPDIERLRRLEHRWESYARASRARYGTVSSLATRQLKAIQNRIRELGS